MDIPNPITDQPHSKPYHAGSSLPGGTVLMYLLLLIIIYVYVQRSKSFARLPPGPKPFPLIGNFCDMPRQTPWLAFDRWFKQYGDIVHINVLGQHIILLGSMDRISDLLMKRSSLYSSRPRMPMVNELMGWDFAFGLMQYTPWWRKHRKLFHNYFHPTVAAKYKPIQLRETRALLRRLLDTPDNFLHHIRHTFAASIMDITYGIRVLESNDPYISVAEECLSGLSVATIPGRFMVDTFPVLKHVPSWLPGASFQRKAVHWAGLNRQLVECPFHAVKEALDIGCAKPSIASHMIETLPNDDTREECEQIAMNTAGIAYAGGADTTVSTIQTFFLAMAMYPEVQKKGQAVLDAVVGPDRLPTFDDRPSLPYIEALVMEALRWQTVAPLALPHACVADDYYDGYYIPKGAIVIGASWTLLNDPAHYPQPELFNPDRFLLDDKINPAVRSPRGIVFGYGRRNCPGRYMVDNSLFCLISSVLSVYEILSPCDDDGNIIRLQPRMSTGTLSHPLPFKCRIQPRSPTAEALIRAIDDKA